MAAARSARLIGLVTWSSMPASRQRSRFAFETRISLPRLSHRPDGSKLDAPLLISPRSAGGWSEFRSEAQGEPSSENRRGAGNLALGSPLGRLSGGSWVSEPSRSEEHTSELQ